MAPTLYYNKISPPCRAVMLTAKAVGLKLEFKDIDVMKGETKTPEFLKINPQHTIPTYVEDDLTLWESRAICQYIANKYGAKDVLYPKDPAIRAQVDRLLYFDFGTLYLSLAQFAYPVVIGNEKPNPDKLAKIHDALALLDQYLEGHFFAVSNRVTIADHTLVATVSSMVAAGIDITKYRNVQRWLERCKSQMAGYDEINGAAVEEFAKIFKTKLRM